MLQITLSPRKAKVALDDPRLQNARRIRATAYPTIGQDLVGEDGWGATVTMPPVQKATDLPWTIDLSLWMATPSFAGRLLTGWYLVETQGESLCYAVLVYRQPAH